MKIGIGIDTGGTCTDGVIYDLGEKKILAAAKTPTTKENLSLGIGAILDLLPEELLRKAQVVSLSTTLATNACVENKGGRSKVIFLGIGQKTVEEMGAAYGLPMDDTLIFIECKETLQGEILKEPDWIQVKKRLEEELKGIKAVGIVELFAAATGAALEKKTRALVEDMGIKTVCGYELFQEKNVIGRGAGTLLNARLISVIAEFLYAVREAMEKRSLDLPIVIVRSDGSLMNERLSLKRPIETLLCGPVASVMGAAELHRAKDGVVIDMGGTTTDISLVKDGQPLRSEDGIAVGDWRIYVKGMYVDTFGLGGDTEVLLDQEGSLILGSRRIMPVCMAASRYPRLLEWLKRERKAGVKTSSWRRDVYVGLKDIEGQEAYSQFERRIAKAFYQTPMSLTELETRHHISVAPHSLRRLVDEGVLIRCGITPTDAMHVLGDYNGYETEASKDAMEVMGALLGMTGEALGQAIYEKVRRRLYCNIARILLLDKYPALRKDGVNSGMEYLLERLYGQAAGNDGQKEGFLKLRLTCDVPLIGVGGPIGVFLSDVAKLLGTTALISEYANVANALGAIVGNVEVCIAMEILPSAEGERYRISGNGESFWAETLKEARQRAGSVAQRLAKKEALRRGASKERLKIRLEYLPVEAATSYGSSIFIRGQVKAYASSRISTESGIL